jgi:hypothetical protein
LQCSLTNLVRVHLLSGQRPLCQICHCYELRIARSLFMTLMYELFALILTFWTVSRRSGFIHFPFSPFLRVSPRVGNSLTMLQWRNPCGICLVTLINYTNIDSVLSYFTVVVSVCRTLQLLQQNILQIFMQHSIIYNTFFPFFNE